MLNSTYKRKKNSFPLADKVINNTEVVGKIENFPSLPKMQVPTFGDHAKEWDLF